MTTISMTDDSVQASVPDISEISCVSMSLIALPRSSLCMDHTIDVLLVSYVAIYAL